MLKLYFFSFRELYICPTWDKIWILGPNRMHNNCRLLSLFVYSLEIPSKAVKSWNKMDEAWFFSHQLLCFYFQIFKRRVRTTLRLISILPSFYWHQDETLYVKIKSLIWLNGQISEQKNISYIFPFKFSTKNKEKSQNLLIFCENAWKSKIVR